jgi:hypothetical protein
LHSDEPIKSFCETCEHPERSLWSYCNYPRLPDVAVGSWMALKQCPTCHAFWCEVPHEPYASFTFLTAWPYDEATWRRIHSLDDAKTLHEWHDAVIRERWQSLSVDERKAIEQWRDRTYRHYNCIDRGPEMPEPLRIKKSTDLAALVEQT